MSIVFFNLEREYLLIGEKITLKLCCLKMLAMEKRNFEKMILIFELEGEGYEIRVFCNVKGALSTIEGF